MHFRVELNKICILDLFYYYYFITYYLSWELCNTIQQKLRSCAPLRKWQPPASAEKEMRTIKVIETLYKPIQSTQVQIHPKRTEQLKKHQNIPRNSKQSGRNIFEEKNRI